MKPTRIPKRFFHCRDTVSTLLLLHLFLGSVHCASTTLLSQSPFNFQRRRRRQASTSLLPASRQTGVETGAIEPELFTLSPFSSSTPAKPSTTATSLSLSLQDCLKTAVAGGVAGAVSTILLYPLDAAKTIRQASPGVFASVSAALKHRVATQTVYTGVWTATLGAIPSSALYFGAYETARRILARYSGDTSASLLQRCVWHAAAAAAGNLVSSAVFVPKELIKQQLQYHAASGNLQHLRRSGPQVVTDILRHQGVRGLYTGYRATVLRNIPSAALRFGLYEEFKRQALLSQDATTDPAWNWKLFLAGAAAGALASGIMTPLDTLKTRVSTGTCPVDLPACVQTVIAENGIMALYAGAGSRMLSSAAFSAIGFSTFEAVKRLLGVERAVVALTTRSKMDSGSSAVQRSQSAIPETTRPRKVVDSSNVRIRTSRVIAKRDIAQAPDNRTAVL